MKRKRYCLMCNVFKPERCHHCSICNRCVLNMDHHCPWINNCVGFYNRKFFMQMLFYLTLTLLYTNICNSKMVVETIIKIYRNRIHIEQEITETLGFLLISLIDLVLNVVIILFFKFHLTIVLENKTTIETIDKKTTEFNSVFDIGKNKNWLQVMGTNKLLWFFPIKLHIGMPIGNGIDWFEKEEDNKKLHNLSISTEQREQNTSSLNNTRNNISQGQNPNNIRVNNNASSNATTAIPIKLDEKNVEMKAVLLDEKTTSNNAKQKDQDKNFNAPKQMK